jgi:hypothetical protein
VSRAGVLLHPSAIKARGGHPGAKTNGKRKGKRTAALNKPLFRPAISPRAM